MRDETTSVLLLSSTFCFVINLLLVPDNHFFSVEKGHTEKPMLPCIKVFVLATEKSQKDYNILVLFFFLYY